MRTTIVAAFVAAALGTVGWQDAPGQRQVLRSAANLVRVDIHVRKDGTPLADLTEADFEVFEDGVRQKIDSLEYVRAGAPQSATPVEPSNTQAMLDLVGDPRNRLFVLFLDSYFVTQENSLQTPSALINMLDTLIGPTDLVGVMTPDMAASEVVFGRKVDVIRRALLEHPRWGRMQENCRDRGNLDQTEQMYSVCYPVDDVQVLKCDISPTALDLIRRKRESFTLGVLRDLVRYIGSTREARTAIVLLSEGWPLFRPNQAHQQQAAREKPGAITIGPGGRLGRGNPDSVNVDTDECARHLFTASQLDDYQVFRDLMDDANRNNASFYIVDPGGLRTDMMPLNAAPGQVPPRGYVETLRTLAENTDGYAGVDSNDLRRGLQRVVDDSSGYYLAGYYSTNDKTDGRYRSISVKVTRPGVDLRFRRGYRAWTAAEVNAMNETRARSTTAAADVTAADRAAALARLGRISPATELYVHAVVLPSGREAYVAGELAASTIAGREWRQGAEAQIVVSGSDKATVGSSTVSLQPGGRAFLSRIPLDRADAAGALQALVRVSPTGGGGSLQQAFQARAGSAALGECLAFRTRNRQDPVASFSWRRTEIARFEAPLVDGASLPTGRLLDRNGKPLAVPVDVTIRDDATGRWAVAVVQLSPLAAGDYLVELTSGPVRRFAALRVER